MAILRYWDGADWMEIGGVPEPDQNTVLTYTGSDLTNVKEYQPNGTTLKTDIDLFYTTGNLTSVVTKRYDLSGILYKTITETMNYTGDNLTSVERSVV